MDMYQYTAYHNPQGAAAVIESYGMQPDRDKRKLASQLAMCVNRDGDNALSKIASVHPDLELYQGIIDNIKKGYDDDKNKMNSHFMNANGQTIKNDIASLRNSENGNGERSTKDLLIIGGIIVLALAIIRK